MAYADGDSDQLVDDGLESDTSAASDAQDGTFGDGLDPVQQELGYILDEEDDKKVAKYVVGIREDRAEQRSRNRATWQRNIWWREGKRGIRLEKKQDQAMWEARLPAGMASAPPVPNKTDRLCRRITNTILVDKPYPDCSPEGDDALDKDAAEFATRYLVEKGEKLNITRLLRSSKDKSHTFGSAFGWATMDPYGGGHRPRTVMAHPQATTFDQATIDPATGQQAHESELVERYVRPDQMLTSKSSDADLQWLPDHKVRLLTGLQVDMLPLTARHIDEAEGVLITDTTTLGELRTTFQDTLEAMTDEEIATLCKYRPQHVKDILPAYTREPEDQKYPSGPKAGKYMDSQMVIVSTIYYRVCAEYPKGCYAVIGGDEFVLHKAPWTAQLLNEDGEPEEQGLMLPVAQDRCLDDDITDNPLGIGIAEHLGPADEVRSSALGFELEHMFRSANPIPFLPTGSIVQPKQFLLRDGSPVFVNPNGKPEMEQVPALSATVPLVREEMGHEMDDESGLQQAAQGVEGPTVKSGIHAQTIVQQAVLALTQIKDNGGDFYVRLNQILLEHARAFISVPELLTYTGEDGSYKAKEFTRVDFRNTKRVTIAKGSYTMHTLLAKQEMANNAFDRQVIDADEYQDLMAGGISPVLGTQDNPALLRIRRQLDQYSDGPSEEWIAQQQAFDSQQAALAQAKTQQQAYGAHVAQAQAQGVAPTMPAPNNPATAEQPLQPPPSPFTNRVPSDLEPIPSKIRHRELRRMMESAKFEAFPPAWQKVLLTEYGDMKNAAGIMTVPEVQQAQAQQQQQQAAQQQQTAQATQAQAQAAQHQQQQKETQAAALHKAALDQKAKAAEDAAKRDAEHKQRVHEQNQQKITLAHRKLDLEHKRADVEVLKHTPVPPQATEIQFVRDASGKVIGAKSRVQQADGRVLSSAPIPPQANDIQFVRDGSGALVGTKATHPGATP